MLYLLHLLHSSSSLFSSSSLLYLVSSNLSPTPTLYLSALHPLFPSPQHGYPPNSQSPSAHFPFRHLNQFSFSLLTPPPFRSASPPPLQPADWTPLFFRAYARFCPRVSKNTSWTLDWTVLCSPLFSLSQRYDAALFFASHQHHHRYHAYKPPRPCPFSKGSFRTRLYRCGTHCFSAAVPTYHISFIQIPPLCSNRPFVFQILAPAAQRPNHAHPQQPNSSRCQAHAGHSLTCLNPQVRATYS